MRQEQRVQLYRHFDGNGVLLYVGISLSSVARLCQHRNASNWFEEIRRIEVEVFPSRRDAEAAETVAIKKENPLHNKAKRRMVGPRPRRPESGWITLRELAKLRMWSMHEVIWARRRGLFPSRYCGNSHRWVVDAELAPGFTIEQRFDLPVAQ